MAKRPVINWDNHQPKLLRNQKLLCYSSTYNLYCKGHRIFFEERSSGKFSFLGCLPIHRKYWLLVKTRLTIRMFRLEPRCGLFLTEDSALISMHGFVYCVNISNKRIEIEHGYRAGMNNPLSFCKVENVEGFFDGVLYGEYFGNTDKEKVSIFQRLKDDVWKEIYTFTPGMIKHIHSIVVHPSRNSIIVLTGDDDNESMILEFKDNFKNFNILKGGRQVYRSCVAFPYRKGILYATDTPLEANSINYLYYSHNQWHKRKVFDIDGPCIFGIQLENGTFIFSTSVEPDSRIQHRKYLFTYKLGKGVRDRYSHIYLGSPQNGFKEIMRAKKDIFPIALFGFGNFQFPNGLSNEIIMTGHSLEKYDGKTFKFSE